MIIVAYILICRLFWILYTLYELTDKQYIMQSNIELISLIGSLFNGMYANTKSSKDRWTVSPIVDGIFI